MFSGVGFLTFFANSFDFRFCDIFNPLDIHGLYFNFLRLCLTLISGNEISLAPLINSKKLSNAFFGFCSLVTVCQDVDFKSSQKAGIVLYFYYFYLVVLNFPDDLPPCKTQENDQTKSL